MKLAFVYDWIDSSGGVERMLTALHNRYPDAPFYTSIVDRARAQWAQSITVWPSFLQRLPKSLRSSRTLMAPLMPIAFESLHLHEFDVVVSISSAFAKGVIVKPPTQHISIVLTPPRYLWVMPRQYQVSPLVRPIQSIAQADLREWDYCAAQRPDRLIAISKHVQERVRRVYGRQSDCLYPPFDRQYWHQLRSDTADESTRNAVLDEGTKSYFLIVARLESYKMIDQAVSAFQHLHDKRLIIVGTGSQQDRMMRDLPANVQWMPHVSDQELAILYQYAQALIMPQEEDFGYTALEAISCGCPVISYRMSGAAEVIAATGCGVVYDDQSVDALIRTVESFSSVTYNELTTDNTIIEQGLEMFSATRFHHQFDQVLKKNSSY